MRSALLGLCLSCACFAQDPQAIVEKLFPKAEHLHRLRLNDIAAHLGLRPGATIADVGCGSGEIALVLSRFAGPKGHVYAEDIDERYALRQARALMKKHKAGNVTVIRGEPADPRLPAGRLDGILLLDVYHEIEKHSQMLAAFERALVPGGKLVIVDPLPRKTGNRPRAVQMKNHVLAPDIADQELREAGYRIVHRDDRFLDHPDSESMQWILVATPLPARQGQESPRSVSR